MVDCSKCQEELWTKLSDFLQDTWGSLAWRFHDSTDAGRVHQRCESLRLTSNSCVTWESTHNKSFLCIWDYHSRERLTKPLPANPSASQPFSTHSQQRGDPSFCQSGLY